MTFAGSRQLLSIRDGDDVVVVKLRWFSAAQLGSIYEASARVEHTAYDREDGCQCTIVIDKETLALECGGIRLEKTLSGADRARVRRCIGEYFVENA